MKYILIAILFFQITTSYAQNDTNNKLTFSGFGEIYYSYDFAKPPNHEKEKFLYNHKRHNEINANLILAKINYLDKNTRANFGLMSGNYAQYNLNSEPTWAQFVYEANIGFKFSKKRNLWLDAGIMPSHIGFESAISADCWTLSRSLAAENSPYFETGIKLSFTTNNEKLNLNLLMLNGWQRVIKPDYIQSPSFGMQFYYKPTEKITLNYSNFVGTDKPDSASSIRSYHNFFVQIESIYKFGIITGFDIGRDKFKPNAYGIWFSPVVILKYKVTNKIVLALRGEYYKDKNQLIVTTNTINGFQVSGVSTNLDYKMTEKIQFRIEGKLYNSKDNFFLDNKKENFSLFSNVTIRF